MKKIIYFVTLFLSFYGTSIAQEMNKLYLSYNYGASTNGYIYDITSFSATPTQIYTTASSVNAVSNLAIGPRSATDNTQIFTMSATEAGSAIYQRPYGGGFAATGNTQIAATGGSTSNPKDGIVYAISRNKELLKVQPNSVNLGAITGDSFFTNGVVSTDSFFDDLQNMYAIVIYNSNLYLYRINITTRVATRVVQINGTYPSEVQGLAYLNGKFYIANGTTESYWSWFLTYYRNTVYVYEVTPTTGASFLKTSYLLTNGQSANYSENLDLASSQLYIPTKADLQVTKTTSNTSPNIGSTIDYTIKVKNAGAINEINAVVNDLLPSGLAYISYTTTTGTYNNTTGIWNIGSLPNNSVEQTLTIKARVDGQNAIVNTAKISGDQLDSNEANNTSSVTITPIKPNIDLSVSKTSNVTAITVGSSYTYTITARNNSALGASGINVTDVLHSNLTFNTSSATLGSYNATNGAWTIGYLPANGTATLSISVTPRATGTIENTATITGYVNDSNSANNSSTVNVSVTGDGTDLKITKTASAATIAPGGTIKFTLVATNVGPKIDASVKVIDKLPNGYTFSSASSPNYNASSGIWDIGNLGIGASATLEINAIASNINGYLTNSAIIYGAETDLDPSNNSSTVTIYSNKDTDGDGILDYIDEDDDNDGILDVEEMGSCEFTNTNLQLPSSTKTVYSQDFGNLNTNTNASGIRPLGLFSQEGGSQLLYKNTSGTTDGNYSLTTNPNNVDDFPSALNQWVHTKDHTTLNNANDHGLMAVFNPSATDTNSYIYQTPAINVSPGAGIDVSLWLLNLKSIASGSGYANPNLTISIVDVATQTILGTSTTGEFIKTDKWENKILRIKPSRITSKIYVRITNSQTSTTGNDFALDDIVVSEIYCDNDFDSTPNHLDLDSDSDDCPDAIEGAGTITSTDLNANKSINGAVDAKGIPTLVNGGQGYGASYDSSLSECLDTDGDGIPDYRDLDKDNDGITDTTEILNCEMTTSPYGTTWPVNNGGATVDLAKQLLFFNWDGISLNNSNPSATKSVTYNGVIYTATIKGFIATDNGITISGNDIQTYGSRNFGPKYNVNGTNYKEVLYRTDANVLSGFQKINYSLQLSATRNGVTLPIEGVIFDAESTATAEYLLFTTNGSAFKMIDKTGTTPMSSTYATGEGTKTIKVINSEAENSPVGMYSTYGRNVTINTEFGLNNNNSKQAVGFGIRILCDKDNDGLPNFLDLDTDGDGCFDAIEGGDVVSPAHLNPDGSINVAENQNVDQNGIPNLVNPGYTADIDDAVAQSINTSQDQTVNSCPCFKTPNTTGINKPTQVGISTIGEFNNWPQNRTGGFLALESSEKGMVINSFRTSEISKITNPQEGMIIFDIDDKCLKIYESQNSKWYCFNKPVCPTN